MEAMMAAGLTRRQFCTATAGAWAASLWPGWFDVHAQAQGPVQAKADRFILGAIGFGSRARSLCLRAKLYGDFVAVADVDAVRADEGRQRLSGGAATASQDYRRVLDRQDIDAVIISTPDHWHAKIAIEAMQAGKDVYCEKPLTLTIDEGKLVRQAVEKTGRVVQVGTQQRSEMGGRFLTAVAMSREGRLGKLKRIQCALGGGPESASLPVERPPAHLDWNTWLGQAPLVEYTPKRCHYDYRWWYEYAGGKITDWGAHHVDIAHWACGANDKLVNVEGTAAHPSVPNGFNTATEFHVRCELSSGTQLVLRHDTANGITLEGESGTIFVSRGRIAGEPVERLAAEPLREETLNDLTRGMRLGDHLRNFFDCVRTRDVPISDVASHHRALTTCHLANIAIRLDRPLQWDADAEQIVGDDEARRWQSREQRTPYQVRL